MQHEENPLVSMMLDRSRAMQGRGRMTKQQEAALVAAAQAGDEDAMTHLLEYHALFVMRIALKYRANYDVNDLFSAGLAGMAHGVQRYRSDKGCGLLSYATHWISQRIRYEIYNNFNTIRIPVHAVSAVFAFRRVYRNGVEPDFDSMRTTRTAQKVSDNTMKHIYNMSPPVRSLDAPNRSILTNDGDEIPLVDSIMAADDDVDSFSDRDYLNRVMLEVLDSRERYAVVQRIIEERTLDDIGVDLGVCRERVRQIVNTSLQKIRKRMETHRRQCDARQRGLEPLATRKRKAEPCPS